MIFSIAMGADYSFYVKTIETHARTFLALNILAIGRVISVQVLKCEFLCISFSSQREVGIVHK